MVLHSEVRDLLAFIKDKKNLRSLVREIEGGTSPRDEDVAHVLDLVNRWNQYPTFVRQIKHDISIVSEYSSRCQYSHKAAGGEQGEDVVLRDRVYYPHNPQPHTIITPKSDSSCFINNDSNARDLDNNYNTCTNAFASPETLTPETLTIESFIPTTLTNPSHTYTPRTKDIHTAYQREGIVGDFATRELLFYSILGKVNVGIESLPGSGKSALLHATLRLLPPKEYVVVNHATTGSLYTNPALQQASFIVIPELQKVFTPEIEEIIKNLAEGQASTHTRTSADRRSVDTLRIDKKSILYSFAITNRHHKKQDEEFLRRFLVLHTDISTKQSKDILKEYARSTFLAPTHNNEEEQFDKEGFTHHLACCIASKRTILNPYLEYITANLPTTISNTLRIRSCIKYFDFVIQGATRFYRENTFETSVGAGIEGKRGVEQGCKGRVNSGIIFSHYHENAQVLPLVGEAIVNTIYGLDVLDRAVLSLNTQDRPVQEFKDDFYTTFGSSAIIRKRLDESLERLVDQGLLRVDTRIHSTSQLPQFVFNKDEAIAAADARMREFYPAQREEWFSKQKFANNLQGDNHAEDGSEGCSDGCTEGTIPKEVGE